MKSESLVIVDHHATVNTSTNLVHTARHAMEVLVVGSLVRKRCNHLNLFLLRGSFFLTMVTGATKAKS